MKIRDSILDALSGRETMISKECIADEEKHEDSPLHRVLSIKFKGFRCVKCYKCDEANFDFCWNCEKPFCKKHAYAIIFLYPYMILNVCKDCRDELIEIAKVKAVKI